MPTDLRPYQRQVSYEAQGISQAPITTYEHLANKLQGFGARLQDTLDVQAKERNYQAGLQAGGQVESIPLPDGSTISGAAFREGANASHLSAVKIDIAENLARIELESGGDPDAFINKVVGYQNGLLAGTSPEVRPLATEEIGFAAMRIQNKLRSAVAARDRANQGAILESGLSNLETEALNYAEQGDEGGILKSMTQYQQLLAQGENALLIPAGDTIKRAEKLQKALLQNVYMGSFNRELEAGRGSEFIQDFYKNKDFAPAEREAMIAKMIGRMNNRHNVSAQAEKIDKLERDKRYRETERLVTLSALEGTLTNEHLTNLLEEDMIDPTLARSMDKIASAGEVLHDDLSVKLEYSVNLLDASEREIAEDARLTTDTRIALINKRRELEDDTENWRRTQNGQEATRRIKAEFGMVDGLIAQLDPEKAKRAGRALTTLYETVEAMPLEQRATSAVDVADKIIKDLKRGDAVSDLELVRGQIKKLPYQTLEDLDKAEEAGDIRGHEAKVLRKRLDSLLNRQTKLESEI